MSRSLWSVALSLLLACGQGGSPPAPTEEPTPTPTPSPSPSPAPTPTPTPTPSPAPTLNLAPTPDLNPSPTPDPSSDLDRHSDPAPAPAPASDPAPTSSGPTFAALPFPPAPAEFTRGPLVRLGGVEVSSREVDDGEVPSVAIADPASRAALDELLARAARPAGMPAGHCRVLLATETLVSLRCIRSVYEQGMRMPDHDISHFRVGTGGDVARIELADLLIPGADEFDLRQRFLYRAARGQQTRMVLSERGLIITEWSAIEEGEHNLHALVDHRSLAPFVRPESPLGELLAAEGLPLAAADATFPPLPAEGRAFWADDPGDALAQWWSASTSARAQSVLATPGGERAAALVFAPGVEFPNAPRGAALFRRPAARVRYALLRRPAAVRVRPGPRADEVATLPEGALVALADGLVAGRDTRIGAGWALVSDPRRRHGWIQGRSLTPLEGCLPPELPNTLVGLISLHEDDVETRYAYRVGAGALTLQPHRCDAAIVEPRELSTEGEIIRQVLFARAEGRRAGESLVAIVTGSATAQRLRVFGMSGDTPLLERDVGDAAVSGPPRRGDYAPFRVGGDPLLIARQARDEPDP